MPYLIRTVTWPLFGLAGIQLGLWLCSHIFL